jgi:O-antigen/teichoic acid export membrane protein
MLKIGLALTGANLFISILGLVRNIVVARLIGVENFGIASTFALTVALVEMSSNIGLDRLLVQARQSEDPKFLQTAHTIQAVRGAMAAIVLYLAAVPISKFFNVPDISWAYQVVALTPLFRGFIHLDMFQQQRMMNFTSSATVELFSVSISLFSVFILKSFFNDYQIMLYAILIHQVTYLLFSHFVATIPYRLNFNIIYFRMFYSFGWPLLINNFVMYMIFYGDRLIIANTFGMKELGLYSAAFALSFTPSIVIARTIGTFFLPQLNYKNDKDYRDTVIGAVNQISILSGMLLGAFFVFFGNLTLLLIYGEKFSQAGNIVGMIGVLQGIRIWKAGAAVIATSNSNTIDPLIANSVRLLTIPVCWLVAINDAGIIIVILIAILGEILAMIVAFSMLHRRRVIAFSEIKLIMYFTIPFCVVFFMDAFNVFNINEFFFGLSFAVILIISFLRMKKLRLWLKYVLMKSKV